MKKFITTILLLFTLISASAQERTVCIKATTAEYFLEADDERFLLRKEVLTLEEENKNQSEEIHLKNSIITGYKVDQITWTEEGLLLDQRATEDEELLDAADRKIRKMRFWRTVERVGTAVLILVVAL